MAGPGFERPGPRDDWWVADPPPLPPPPVPPPLMPPAPPPATVPIGLLVGVLAAVVFILVDVAVVVFCCLRKRRPATAVQPAAAAAAAAAAQTADAPSPEKARLSNASDPALGGISFSSGSRKMSVHSPAAKVGAGITGGARQPYVGFVSHFKEEAAMEARFLQTELEQSLGRQARESPRRSHNPHTPHAADAAPSALQLFLDSDDLRDLRELLEHVKQSEVLLLLQSTTVLTRPYCLLELLTAIDNGVPIVGVSVVGRHASAGFDHAAAETFLANLDARLDGRATALLAQNGVTDLVDAAYKLSSTLPKVISIPFDPSASRNVLRGTITDIAEAMSHARTLPLPDKDAWHTSRVADQNILDQTDQ